MINIRVSWLILIINILIAIPLLTLFERKIIGYIQFRKGPNKVSYLGLLQPIRDGVKLILKEMGTPLMSSRIMFWISPFLLFRLMLLSWLLFPSFFRRYFITLRLIFLLCILKLNVHLLLGSGWGSKSKYALIGGIRGAAQAISYEVSLMFILFFPCRMEKSYNLYDFLDKRFPYILIYFPITIVWLISILAETNRRPFDFSEGERELVSGFNVEYGGVEFTFLFIAEYGKILLMSYLSRLLFFWNRSYLIFGMIIAFLFVWIRATLPRFRYDFLMDLCWKVFLPISLSLVFCVFI